MQNALKTIATTFSKRLTKAPEPIKVGTALWYRGLLHITEERARNDYMRAVNAERMAEHYRGQVKIVLRRLDEFHQTLNAEDNFGLTDEETLAECRAIYAEHLEIMKDDI